MRFIIIGSLLGQDSFPLLSDMTLVGVLLSASADGDGHLDLTLGAPNTPVSNEAGLIASMIVAGDTVLGLKSQAVYIPLKIPLKAGAQVSVTATALPNYCATLLFDS